MFNNFTFHNPVKLIFGKGTIAKLSKNIPANSKILLTYGGGSIFHNGVYDQVMNALKGYEIVEFGGIEANPTYETLMNAVELGKKENIDFILSVGGGSVLDGTKFIAAAIPYNGEDHWQLVLDRNKFGEVIPFGDVLTLPATGSEMNYYAVISRKETNEKKGMGGPALYPQFSILDPETTYFYRIVAFNEAGASNNSSEMSITTEAPKGKTCEFPNQNYILYNLINF